MKSKLLLRIAAGCVLFFAVGHTMGHFQRDQVQDEKEQMVLRTMKENRFDMFGQMRSYDENYTGMSWNLIITLLAFALVIWILASYIDSERKLAVKLLTPIGIALFGFAVTSYLYFFLVPAVTSFLAALLVLTAVVISERKMLKTV